MINKAWAKHILFKTQGPLKPPAVTNHPPANLRSKNFRCRFASGFSVTIQLQCRGKYVQYYVVLKPVSIS